MTKSNQYIRLKQFILLLCLSLAITLVWGCNSVATVKDKNASEPTLLQKSDVSTPSDYPTREVTPRFQPSTTDLQPIVPTFTAAPLLASSTPPSEEVISMINSPLKDVSLQELSQILSNPFLQPSQGQDDGHHGADFAFYRWKEWIGMTGLPVYSVFDGHISAVIYNSMPYGNFVIIETFVNLLPIKINKNVAIPSVPTIMPDSRLTCPPETLAKSYDFSKTSVYLLYAHLDTVEDWHIGDTVHSGQAIGTVGNTGLSSNPHLHLELRIGPSNATFTEMSHYRADATNDAMANYCLWRASETFQLIDPMVLFSN